MHFSILALMALATLTAALPNALTTRDWSPSCGGDQAVCCTGSYDAEGEVVDNCITCTAPFSLPCPLSCPCLTLVSDTPYESVCSVDSNVYCCYTCAEAIGSCIACSHYY